MDDLVEFLRARLAEEKAEAEKQPDDEDYGLNPWAVRWEETGTYDSYGYVRVAKARVLAEVEAKRGIVDAYLPPGGDPHPGLPCTDDIEGDPDGEVYAEMLFPDACVRHLKASERLLHHDYVLRLLAAVYAAHPDYRQEWAPDAWPRGVVCPTGG